MPHPILFYGGTRHMTPGSGFTTETMTLVKAGAVGLPPYETERYVRTDLRFDVGSATDAVVFVLDGTEVDERVEAAMRDLAAYDRTREHFEFIRTGKGRPWGT